jgi:hypothetical protein
LGGGGRNREEEEERKAHLIWFAVGVEMGKRRERKKWKGTGLRRMAMVYGAHKFP